MTGSNISFDVKGVSKKFKIGAKTNTNFREALLSKLTPKLKDKSKDFWALKDITFTITKGESCGIIGSNGAGKSTLLKILSRITRPSKGTVEIHGKLASLLEVGTGFHPELTGRENIYLNGAILGMKRREIRTKITDIIDFSGVGDFVETPVKHFSSGMKVRLAFSVAAHLDTDILVVDEVLAVGDAEFQKRCMGTMGDLAHSGRTVLFVSHNMGAVSQLCSRALVLANGEMIYDGAVDKAIANYTQALDTQNTYENHNLDPQKEIQIIKVFLLNTLGHKINSFVHDESIKLCLNFEAQKYVKGLNICISVYNYLHYPIFTSDVSLKDYSLGKNKAMVTIPPNVLKPGNYTFLLAIHSPNAGVGALEFLQYICPMTIYDNGSEFSRYNGIWETGDVFVECEWEFN